MKFYFTLCIFSLTTSLIAQSDKDPLLKLQQHWNTARQKALAPVTANYIRQLETLMKEETRKGNLTLALRIQSEIDKVKSDIDLLAETNFTGDQLRDALKDTMWTGQSGVINGWTVQLKAGGLRQPGTVDLIKPDGTNGWGGWTWSVDEEGVLWLSIPNQAKPIKASISRKLDQIDLNWGKSTISRFKK